MGVDNMVSESDYLSDNTLSQKPFSTKKKMYIFLSLSGPMSANPVRRKYSRHIDIRRHYIREQCLGRLLSYDSTFLEPQAVLQIESLFPIRSDRKYGLRDHNNCGACALTSAEILITYALK